MNIISLIRPQQWVKNVFVFLPMFFSGNIFNGGCWLEALVAFITFSLMASAVYCLNDIWDVEADRRHPKKCKRPVASGAVSERAAWVVMCILIAASLTLALLLPEHEDSGNIKLAGVLLLYLVPNIAYCIWLKHIAIVDVFVVSFGFVLRLLAGGVVCHIWLSPWIVLLTFLLALFLAFAKRRDDVMLMERRGIMARKNIVRYNSDFLNQTLSIVATMTMMCYVMYSVSPEVESRFSCHYVYVTSVFVLAGILRYLQVTIVDCRSGSPTKILLHDRFIQAVIVCWVAVFVLIIYL